MPLALLVTLLAQTVVLVDNQPFTSLYTNSTKPYLHPLRTASGKIITRQFPMDTVDGETKDHPHHRGLWFSHGDVNGWDFWANEPDQKGVNKGKGVIKAYNPKTLYQQMSRASMTSITFTADWESPDGVLLREDRGMTFTGDKTTRIINFDINLTAEKDVKFGDTKEGTFAIRLRDELTEQKGTGKMVSSDGKEGEKQVWGKAFPWVDYVGKLDDETVGIAILDHPSNPRHPTYWHARAYGLFAANIFGLHDFYNDKSKDGSLTLKKGEKLRFRYQVVIHDGDTATAKIADRYQQFSKNK